jgi:hypothetical protein
MPQTFDARGERTASRSPARALGPYESAYDVRRGYTDPPPPAAHHIRHDEDEVWRGRGRDER